MHVVIKSAMPKQQQIEHILTPETEKHFFTDQILPPLLHGESITIIWTFYGGIQTQMKFLQNHSRFFGFNKLGSYKIIRINPRELTDDGQEAFFSLMLYNLDQNFYDCIEKKPAFFALKEKIIRVLDKNNHLIIVIEEFNKLNFPENFYNNLFALWQIEKSKIHFIFCTTENILTDEFLQKYGKFKEAIIQNISYFPLLSSQDSEFVIKRLANRYSYPISEKMIPTVIKISGGYIGLIKECLRLLDTPKGLSENEMLYLLKKDYGIKILLENLWDSFTESDKKELTQIVTHQINDCFKVSDFLLNLGIVHKNKSNYSLFSSVFSSFVEGQPLEKQTITIDKTTNEILVNNQVVKQKITLTEFRLLKLFLSSLEKIVTRDEIAQALWEQKADDKYSDWAIDQNISLLRKKLKEIGISPSRLQTIKGRGYRFVK